MARDRVLLLDVQINGQAIGKVGEFHEHQGRLYATRKELRELGFRLPNSGKRGEANGHAAAADPKQQVSLGSIPGVSYRVDERTQVLYVTAAMSALLPTEIASGINGGAAHPVLQSGFGAVLNYTLDGTSLLQRGTLSSVVEALMDARVFSRWGIADISFTAAAGAIGSAPPLQRLDTTYSYSDPDTLRRYRVGDLITGGLAFTRPIRLGGVQISTDFAIRPDLVTFPVPSIAGQVAVPSSVDVLVNGVQVLSRDVPPGPFEIQQLPVVTGAGEVDVVTRDANGQQTRQTLPIYASNLLLAPGLQSYSAELGSVRLNYAGPGDSYHGAAGSFSYRRGMLPWLTLQGHAEGSLATRLPADLVGPGGGQGGAMGGGGATLALGRIGALSLNGGWSHFGRHSGAIGAADFERAGRILSLGGSIQMASRGFRDVAAAYGDTPPTLQVRGSAGFSLGPFGSLGFAYVGERRRSDLPTQQNVYGPVDPGSAFGLNAVQTQQADKVSLVSASYSRPLFNGRAFIYATGFAELAHPRGRGITAGITVPLGTRGSASASLDDEGQGLNGSFGATQSANDIGDAGFQVIEDTGAPSRQMAIGEYKSPWGIISGGVDRIDGQTSLRGSAQGSVAVADGGVFAANTINDSFAIVDTGGVKGVGVLQENRPVGHTDASGLLLVPDLRAFEANRVAINPADVPLDAQVEQTTRLVRPQDRSGVVVHFGVRSSQGAVLRLVDGTGKPLSVGGSAHLAGTATTSDVEVGYDGEAFITGLRAHDTLIVKQRSGGRCRAEFDYRPVARTLPRIGPVRCLAIAA